MKNAYLVVLGIFAAACGGQAITNESDASPGNAGGSSGGVTSQGGSAGQGGTAAGGSSVGGTSAGGSTSVDAGQAGGSGGASTGGSAGAGWEDGGLGVCTPAAGGSGGFEEPTCADLDGIVVSTPVIKDGLVTVSPGETVHLSVQLREVAGQDFMYYPGVSFTSDHPAVELTGDWLYGIAACTSVELTATATFSDTIEPGTVVTISGQVAMLSEPCPGASSTSISVLVE